METRIDLSTRRMEIAFLCACRQATAVPLLPEMKRLGGFTAYMRFLFRAQTSQKVFLAHTSEDGIGLYKLDFYIRLIRRSAFSVDGIETRLCAAAQC